MLYLFHMIPPQGVQKFPLNWGIHNYGNGHIISTMNKGVGVVCKVIVYKSVKI